MPQLGFGVWQVSNEEIVPAVECALATGYRSIDTAAAYGNERGVGDAVRNSGVPREEVFITTKLWNPMHHAAHEGLENSLRELQTDYVDLYLIHWPVPVQGRYVEAYQALVRLRQAGKAKSIGVSNFNVEHLEEIIDATGVVPAVNQVELHPLFQQKELRAFHEAHGIVTESWSPLGRGRLEGNELLEGIAAKHGRSMVQVVLRWNLDMGFVVIPKSVTPERIRQNFDLFSFNLDREDLAAIATLDAGIRLGGDPKTSAYGVKL